MSRITKKEEITLGVSGPQDAIINTNQEYNLFLAGQGSGKTHTMGFISYNYIKNFPSARGLICANTYSQLSKSTLVQIFKVWKECFGIEQDVHYVVDKQPLSNFERIGEKLKDYKNTISFSNGALIYLASLDNYKAIDGMEVSYALLDETKDTKEAAVKEVIIGRLRQNKIFIDELNRLHTEEPNDVEVKGFNPLFVFTSPAKVQWLNEMFKINDHLEVITKHIFSKTDFYCAVHGNKLVVISSTYHNERNLPKGWIESRKSVWDDTPGLTDMLLYGSPMAKTGGEWYSRYNRDKHVKNNLLFDVNYPLHVSFDFNVVPYMPALAMQIVEEKNDTLVIRVLKEYACKYPNNTTSDVCDEIILDFAGLTNSIYYYGDASGKNRHTAVTDKSIRHNYDVIRSKLSSFLFEGSDRVPTSNPPIYGRRILMNSLFAGKKKVIIEIDAGCINLINDLEYLKEDGNGGYKKPKATDPVTGATFEKLGHHSDSFIYFCFENFEYITKFE